MLSHGIGLAEADFSLATTWKDQHSQGVGAISTSSPLRAGSTASGIHTLPLLCGDLKAVADKHGLRLAEVGYRWFQHHGALLPSDHGVIVGTSRAKQLEDAIEDKSVQPSLDPHLALTSGVSLARKVHSRRKSLTSARTRGNVSSRCISSTGYDCPPPLHRVDPTNREPHRNV